MRRAQDWPDMCREELGALWKSRSNKKPMEKAGPTAMGHEKDS